MVCSTNARRDAVAFSFASAWRAASDTWRMQSAQNGFAFFDGQAVHFIPASPVWT